MIIKRKLFSKKDNNKKLKEGAGLSSIIGGGYLISKSNNKGDLTGRHKFYHSTEKKNVKSILKSGLKGSKALEDGNFTNSFLHGAGKDDGRELVYLAKNKKSAKNVSDARIEAGRGKSKTLKVEIPHEDYKKMKIANGNPELEGAKTYKEFLNNSSYRKDNRYNRSLWKDLGGDKNSNTRMIEGNIDSKYIVDGKGYKKLSTKELKNYIKKNPKKFLRGAGKLSLGVSGVYVGGKLLRNNAENSKSNSIDNSEKFLAGAGAVGAGIKTAKTELKKVEQNDIINRSRIDRFSSGSLRKRAKIVDDLVKKEGVRNFDDIYKRAGEAVENDINIERKAQEKGMNVLKKAKKIGKQKSIAKGALVTSSILGAYAGYRKYRKDKK